MNTELLKGELITGDAKLIIAECIRRKVLRNQAAYILATAYWETARTFKPVKEAYWVKNAERWRRKNLRYYPWYGRGYVQLTWERNYRFAGKKLGRDFITDPEAVMEPKASAEILVAGSMEGWFTGRKIPDYITLKKSNFKGARRVINGTDKAREIAKIARKFDKMLLDAGYGVTVEIEVVDAPGGLIATPVEKPDVKPQPQDAVTDKESLTEILVDALITAIAAAIRNVLKNWSVSRK